MVDLSIGGLGKLPVPVPGNRGEAVGGLRLAPEMLGRELLLEVVSQLSDNRYLVQIDGQELVAEGDLPLAAGKLYPVQITRVSPGVVVRVLPPAGAAEMNFPALGPAAAALLGENNAFAGRLLQLGPLLATFAGVPELEGLRQVTATLVASNGPADFSRLAGVLGLALEASLAAGADPGMALFSAFLAPRERSLKAELLQARRWLSRQEPTAAGNELSSLVQDLLGMVELNQVLNNPGVRQFPGLQLVVPFFSPETGTDIWLRLERREPEGGDGGSGGEAYALTIYLELTAFGPVSSHLLVDRRQVLATVEVSGRRQLELLAAQVVPVEAELQSRHSRPVRIYLRRKPAADLRSLWRQRFTASLPPLLHTSA